MKKITALFFMVLLLSACTHNQADLALTEEKGAEVPAVDSRFQYALKRAQSGDYGAMYALAMLYARGDSVEQDNEQARYWLLQAAEGDGDAQSHLAVMYQYGNDLMEKNYEQAIYYYEKAIASGVVAAQTNLGVLYVLQSPPEYRNPDKGFALAMQAARQGDGRGMCVVGECYQHGVGVKVNSAQALKWYEKSYQTGYVLGMHYYADMLLARKQYRQARKIFEETAPYEDWGGSLRHLGDMYLYGQGVERDYPQAFAYYTQAAEQGNQWAMLRLGHMYEKGLGVVKDNTQALICYRASMTSDEPDNRLTYRFEQGLSLENLAAKMDVEAALAIKRLAKGRENPY